MNTFRAELHVHTVLSPCAELEMIPPLIISEALEKGIQVLAVTDHNASANAAAVQKAAAGTGIAVLAGMEVETREEVHVLCLFDTAAQAEAWQAQVDAHLPALQNRVDFFGDQFIVDDTGEFLARETRLLLTSTLLTIREVWEGATALGGLVIPAHVDRKANGLVANLGFVPLDVPIEILEYSRHMRPEQIPAQFRQIMRYPYIVSGDAHRLDELLGRNQLWMEAPTTAEIRRAVLHQDGRSHQILY